MKEIQKQIEYIDSENKKNSRKLIDYLNTNVIDKKMFIKQDIDKWDWEYRAIHILLPITIRKEDDFTLNVNVLDLDVHDSHVSGFDSSISVYTLSKYYRELSPVEFLDILGEARIDKLRQSTRINDIEFIKRWGELNK